MQMKSFVLDWNYTTLLQYRIIFFSIPENVALKCWIIAIIQSFLFVFHFHSNFFIIPHFQNTIV